MRAFPLAVALVLAAVGAGCTGPQPSGGYEAPTAPAPFSSTQPIPGESEGTPAPIPPPPPPLKFEYACPAGPKAERVPDVCMATLWDSTKTLAHPSLSIHPNLPHVMAVGVTSFHLPAVAQGDLQSTGLDVRIGGNIELYVNDNGQEWRPVPLPALPILNPPVPLQLINGNGASIAFDDNGTLHLTGVATYKRGSGGMDAVFYTSTSDLGKTWTTPIKLNAAPNVDQSFLTVGPNEQVYVVWKVSGGAQVAWSLDGGKTWPAGDRLITVTECPVISRILLVDGVPHAACNQGQTRVSFVKIDLTAGKSETLATILTTPVANNERPPLLANLSNGSLALATPTDVFFSVDGGRNWTTPVQLQGLLTVEDDWTNFFPTWMAGDPWGRLQLLVSGVRDPVVPDQVETGQIPVAHVVLEQDPPRVFLETRLTPLEPANQFRSPPTAGPPFTVKDRFHGIAFTPDAAVLMWTFDRGLDYTILKPVLT